MSNSNYCVYMHIVPKEISGYAYDKRYVGITSRNPEERWGKDGENYSRQFFGHAIQKYGWDNIQHVIVYEGLTQNEASQKEMELIEKYETKLGYKGYNASNGGEVSNLSGSNMYHPVYCIETNVAYKNPMTASAMTGENISTLRNRLQSNDNGVLRKGYHWCRIDKIYQHFYNSHPEYKPIVYLKNCKIYGHCGFINKEFNTKFTSRHVISLEKYINLLDKGKDVSNKILLLEDYLKIYDYTM